jgi:hypothetical protein
MKRMVPLIAESCAGQRQLWAGSAGVKALVGRSPTTHPTNHSAVIEA